MQKFRNIVEEEEKKKKKKNNLMINYNYLLIYTY